jgi:nitrate reductase assembly molybdenum cofactor insertion protein NarJ
MTATELLTDHELRLAHESAEWRLIAQLFECPSDLWRKQISALAKEVADTELKSAVEDALQQANEGLFHYTFSPGGPAPVREASYHQTVELGYLMSELQAYYNGFAFQPRTAEPPDHISVEAGFVAYLKLKELYAVRCGEENRAATASESAHRFMQDHLANFAQPLYLLLQDSGITYLSKAAAALARRVGPPSGASVPLPIVQGEQAEEDFGCGIPDGASNS